jgi:hypothetical protein
MTQSGHCVARPPDLLAPIAPAAFDAQRYERELAALLPRAGRCGNERLARRLGYLKKSGHSKTEKNPITHNPKKAYPS